MKNFSSHQARFNMLRNMILEMAAGNFANRVQILDGVPDELDDLAILLNMLAEELSDFFIYAHSFGEKNMSDPYTFLIDQDLKIQATNHKLKTLLAKRSNTLLDRSILKFLSKTSSTNLKQSIIGNSRTNVDKVPLKILLEFKISKKYSIECWGYLHFLQNKNSTLYFFRGLPFLNKEVNPKKSNNKTIKPRSKKAIQLQIDILRIRDVHQFVLNNLHQTLPSLPTLAREFNLNEYKLKRGFKELYNTTIFKLHLEKRLEMAMLLIKDTPTSFKVISKQYGFCNYTHFAKAFKAKFNNSPSYFRKESSDFNG